MEKVLKHSKAKRILWSAAVSAALAAWSSAGGEFYSADAEMHGKESASCALHAYKPFCQDTNSLVLLSEDFHAVQDTGVVKWKVGDACAQGCAAFHPPAQFGFMFVELLAALGPGVEVKHIAMRKIVQHPENFAGLEINGVPLTSLALQTLRFIEKHTRAGFSLACFDSTAQRFMSPFAPNGKVFFSVHTCFLEEKRDKGLAVWEGLGLDDDLHSLSVAVRFFFRMPGVFRDLMQLQNRTLYNAVELVCKSPNNKKKLQQYMRLWGESLHFSSDFSFFLECLVGVAGGVIALQESEPPKSRLHFKGKLERLNSCMKKDGFLCEGPPSGMESTFIKQIYLPMLQGFLSFYAVCLDHVTGFRAQGKRAFFPSETHTSTFKFCSVRKRMFYWEVKTEENSEFLGFADVDRPAMIDMQHVCYVDSEEQARKPVVIPQCQAEISCAEIAKYIADLYEKPLEHIHVFSLNLLTLALTYKNPESTPYIRENSVNNEILVFYYIPESVLKDARLRLVMFWPLSEKSLGPAQRVVRLPLFLGSLMFESLPLSMYMPHENKGSMQDFSHIESVFAMLNQAPHVFYLGDTCSQDYYPQATVRLDCKNMLDLDINYALCSVSCHGPTSQGYYAVSYKTRKVERELGHTVFVDKWAGLPGEQHMPDFFNALQKKFQHQGRMGSASLFWRVISDQEGNALMILLGAAQCAQLGLCGNLLRVIMG
ncbi:uncharacterized protein NEMAJ01_2000 [Nematocida major]|uniref:uncharacterized protein n=1 Tax=Nematocida major TaxID=1912982 RepID=UPI002007776E|nr:uncharacterized protein NEMAJ01_2000 [Nematocida major]KAH9387104.1 hypothetical protein NEMAJ01_2000 [Nematocida major]